MITLDLTRRCTNPACQWCRVERVWLRHDPSTTRGAYKEG